ncbi:MAG: sulfite exporter TauE/SafE family protein [Bacteroidetes bacterium]|nr:sulfite exporter TauE/SafE family protein [Bacteroidales bacterium]MBU1008551.1 sulfite exporter TauE/SafE family protein [Bacteroidota bacterium]
MNWLEITALIVSGVFVGFINTLAGGGTIISLSVFLIMGLPIDIANGTNRVAVILQNITSVQSFHKKKVLDLKKGSWLAIPAVIGSILGAQLAVDINKDAFEKAIAVVMLAMIFFMFYKPSAYLTGNEQLMKKKVSWLQALVFFGIGVYGGMFQVGVGYFLLAALVLGAGFDLVRANAVKVWIVLLYTIFALVVFVINGAVNWKFGLIHAIGNMIGAYVASHLAVNKGVVFVKWVIVVVIILTSAQLIGLYDMKTVIGFFIGH